MVTFFFFFQNFHKPFDFMFWHSWSLSIEEWFYVSFPFVLMVLHKCKLRFNLTSQKIVLTSICLFLVLPLVYRLYCSTPLLDTDLYFRKLVLTRLDTIAFGLLAAYLHWYHASFWKKSKNTFFVFGFFLMGLSLILDVQNTFYNQTFYFSLQGLSMAFLLPKLSSMKHERIRFKPVQFVSKISYSIYAE